MTLAFRNVDFDPRAPVREWPAEAILTALERGSLEQSRPIADAIADDPWGQMARTVDAVTRDGDPYGVGPGLQRAVLRARRRWEDQDRASVAGELQQLRLASGLSSAQFARRLGTSPSRMSTYLSGQVVPSAALMVRARRVAGTRTEP